MKKHDAITPNLSERIVIVGGGFAGVTLAQRLERLLPAHAEIIVLVADDRIDDRGQETRQTLMTYYTT